MKSLWRTAWQGQEIVVYRDETVVDRITAAQIERVIFVHRDSGYSPGDLMYALVLLPEECLMFPADTGFAGRVNFERQSYWAERGCVYWVNASQASLPLRLRRGRWLLGSGLNEFARWPRSEIGPMIERWPLQGPQTWEERKWRRIEKSRMFADLSDSRLRS